MERHSPEWHGPRSATFPTEDSGMPEPAPRHESRGLVQSSRSEWDARDAARAHASSSDRLSTRAIRSQVLCIAPSRSAMSRRRPAISRRSDRWEARIVRRMARVGTSTSGSGATSGPDRCRLWARQISRREPWFVGARETPAGTSASRNPSTRAIRSLSPAMSRWRPAMSRRSDTWDAMTATTVEIVGMRISSAGLMGAIVARRRWPPANGHAGVNCRAPTGRTGGARCAGPARLRRRPRPETGSAGVWEGGPGAD